jgi:hypothetical protein
MLITLPQVLEYENVDTTITWEGAEARQLIASGSFDLIIIGDHPPELDAARLLRDLSLQGVPLTLRGTVLEKGHRVLLCTRRDCCRSEATPARHCRTGYEIIVAHAFRGRTKGLGPCQFTARSPLKAVVRPQEETPSHEPTGSPSRRLRWLTNVPIPCARQHSTASGRADSLSSRLELTTVQAGGTHGKPATFGYATPAAAP